MAVVIRVVYNNQDWQAPCETPGQDSRCWRCLQPGLGIERPDPSDKVCSGDCWERRLRTEYRYGCIPKGRTYGNRAQPGTKVFFVFRQPHGKYTLWGKTTIRSIDSEPVKEGQNYEKGYAFAHFEPFEPMPKEKWVPNLSDKELVGSAWRMGLHRYIDAGQEAKLEQFIAGLAPEKRTGDSVATSVAGRMSITIDVAPTMYANLKNVATNEGRGIDEIVREAIAEWLKGRK